MENYGIVFKKTVKFFSTRDILEETNRSIQAGDIAWVIGAKYRNGKNWLEIELFDNDDQSGYILDSGQDYQRWLYYKNEKENLPLFDFDGEKQNPVEYLPKGQNYHVISTAIIFSLVSYNDNLYRIKGMPEGKVVSEPTDEQTAYILAAIASGFIFVIFILPRFPSGTYPRIVLFLPVLIIGFVIFVIISFFQKISKRF